MKKLFLAGTFFAMLLPSLALPNLALADDAKGTILSIDQSSNTFTLDNGNTYTLPGEFDYSVISEGMKVLVFYDKQGANLYVNDIEPQNN